MRFLLFFPFRGSLRDGRLSLWTLGALRIQYSVIPIIETCGSLPSSSCRASSPFQSVLSSVSVSRGGVFYTRFLFFTCGDSLDFLGPRHFRGFWKHAFYVCYKPGMVPFSFFLRSFKTNQGGQGFFRFFCFPLRAPLSGPFYLS